MRALFVGGLLPVIVFTLIEEGYGIVAGLIAGMVFGVGEILYEWRTQGRVDAITWGGNGMLLLLGGISLLTNEGVWFKLQPAIIEAVMGLVLLGSVWMGKPLLWVFFLKQQQKLGREIHSSMKNRVQAAISGMTVRVAIFFLCHAALATQAALHWSTAHWALLKGVGFTVSMVAYMLIESLVLRRSLSNPSANKSSTPEPPAQ